MLTYGENARPRILTSCRSSISLAASLQETRLLATLHFRRGARKAVSVRTDAGGDGAAAQTKLDVAELKQHDPRAPLDEIKRMTEQDPKSTRFVLLRMLVEKKKPTPKELLIL